MTHLQQQRSMDDFFSTIIKLTKMKYIVSVFSLLFLSFVTRGKSTTIGSCTEDSFSSGKYLGFTKSLNADALLDVFNIKSITTKYALAVILSHSVGPSARPSVRQKLDEIPLDQAKIHAPFKTSLAIWLGEGM